MERILRQLGRKRVGVVATFGRSVIMCSPKELHVIGDGHQPKSKRMCIPSRGIHNRASIYEQEEGESVAFQFIEHPSREQRKSTSEGKGQEKRSQSREQEKRRLKERIQQHEKSLPYLQEKRAEIALGRARKGSSRSCRPFTLGSKSNTMTSIKTDSTEKDDIVAERRHITFV